MPDLGAGNEPAPICHANHVLALGTVFDATGTESGEAYAGVSYGAAGYEFGCGESDYPGLNNMGRNHYPANAPATESLPIKFFVDTYPKVWNPYAVDNDGDGNTDFYALTVEDGMAVSDGVSVYASYPGTASASSGASSIQTTGFDLDLLPGGGGW